MFLVRYISYYCINNCLVFPTYDQSEYVAAADERRAWISGFGGSAGTAVLLSRNGQRALWTDGRYFLAADQQLDCEWLLMKGKQEGVSNDATLALIDFLSRWIVCYIFNVE